MTQSLLPITLFVRDTIYYVEVKDDIGLNYFGTMIAIRILGTEMTTQFLLAQIISV